MDKLLGRILRMHANRREDIWAERVFMPMPDMVPREVQAYWLDYFATDDIRADVKRATDLGATLTVPPMDVGGGMLCAVLDDPAGATFALLEMAPE